MSAILITEILRYLFLTGKQQPVLFPVGQEMKMISHLQEKASGMAQFIEFKMGKNCKTSYFTESFAPEIYLSHPGHEVQVSESSQTILDIRFHKVAFAVEFVFPFVLINQESL